MADEAEKESAVRKQAIKLDPLPRFTVGLLGAAGLAGGSIATFTQDVEAGPGAMLAIGAIFFLIGIAGVLPTRLKVGENEAEFWQEVGDKVEEIVDQLPPATRAEVLEKIAASAPEAAAPALRGIAYEELVIQMIR